MLFKAIAEEALLCKLHRRAVDASSGERRDEETVTRLDYGYMRT